MINPVFEKFGWREKEYKDMTLEECLFIIGYYSMRVEKLNQKHFEQFRRVISRVQEIKEQSNS